MANDLEFEVPVNAQDKCLKLAPGVHSEGPTVGLIMVNRSSHSESQGRTFLVFFFGLE